MSDHIHQIADDFWNVRGSFRIFGVVDIGTQTSLVRKADGRFLLLDSYPLRGDVLAEVESLTDGGSTIDAVLNLHPFHTVHVESTHERFPHADLYGTARHASRAPDLPWQSTRTEDPALGELFPDLEFSVPAGVHLIPDNEHHHFASVLAFHPSSRVLHVDDTLMHTKIPFMSGVRFHPTLKNVLKQEAGAVRAFREWARQLIERCGSVDHLCAAHTRPLVSSDGGSSIADRVASALDGVSGVLDAHEKRWG